MCSLQKEASTLHNMNISEQMYLQHAGLPFLLGRTLLYCKQELHTFCLMSGIWARDDKRTLQFIWTHRCIHRHKQSVIQTFNFLCISRRKYKIILNISVKARYLKIKLNYLILDTQLFKKNLNIWFKIFLHTTLRHLLSI